MSKKTVYSQESIGSAPPPAVQGGGMVHAGDYLFVFGGKSKSKFTMMYGCYLPRTWWFVFFIAPDGESTSQTDGRVSKDGLFLLPGISDFSACYVPENRQIVAFMGHPHKNPVPIFVVSMADALSVLNLREDILAMISF
ncbi:hypothetical protein TRFO_01727 [Tritrichomonas foetus]|uniref:Uncharacterized protein n=1 Tax=Tritrichomonas foetus TaxID=1144522 RepID=A0A1J4JQW3_9EUKA|nr:hypothetical protein TRFO_01727 [Tritrichomonas foetus]|eukprot:OHT01130.1 hypothetical protein TRFO_01727 [Tritrichomonas foetus]